MKITSRRIKHCAILLAVGIFAAGIVSAHLESKTPFGIARKANTIEAYEQYIKENPNDSRVAEAEKEIRLKKYSFRPKFFITWVGRDVSSEINFFDFSITSNQDDAKTLAYVDAPETDENGGYKITVRLVDKKTSRERTIVATSTQPEWVRVTAVGGRPTSSGGGAHTIDGHTHSEAHNGHGLLLADILEYAQKLETEPK